MDYDDADLIGRRAEEGVRRRMDSPLMWVVGHGLITGASASPMVVVARCEGKQEGDDNKSTELHFLQGWT